MGFPTPLLDARLAKEKKQNEEDRPRSLQMTVAWLEENAARYGVDQGYVFGSMTEGDRFSQHSGVDLAVGAHKAGDIFALMGALSMHLNRDVDVVPLDQCHFASKIRKVGIEWSANTSLDSPRK